MSQQGPTGPPPTGGMPPSLPSEEIRYDLNGNPMPAQPRETGGPYVASPSPAPQYSAPPPTYSPPGQVGYGTPPPQNSSYGAPPPAYGAPPPTYGAQPYGAARPAGQPSNKAGWYVACGVAFVVILVLIGLARAGKPELVDTPTAFKPVDCPDKSFTVDGPDGWTTETAGVEGSQQGGVLFKKGAVKIDITSSDALSFMGDAMRSPAPASDDPNMPAPPPPVEKMHNMLHKNLADRYDNYQEMPAQPLQVRFGDTRISEWTAKGGMFVGNLHGYRVTMLGLNKAITIDCNCPESNWATMQPVFLKVIQSIVPGNG